MIASLFALATLFLLLRRILALAVLILMIMALAGVLTITPPLLWLLVLFALTCVA